MLLNSNVVLINKLKIKLSFDDDVSKTVVINVDDIIGVTYKIDNTEKYIKGKIKTISCNFNSSIGRVESAIFIEIDGSGEYNGNIVYIKPDNILNINVFTSNDIVLNPVISVDNEEQRILMIRENELGLLQYSKDGLTWSGTNETVQGLSAYEVAIKLGYEGTEEEWLESMKGDTGPAGKSAYDIAVVHGFIGTEEEWLESLKTTSTVDINQQRADIDYISILLNLPLN